MFLLYCIKTNEQEGCQTALLAQRLNSNPGPVACDSQSGGARGGLDALAWQT